MNDTQKSLSRSKTSLISLADIIAKDGISNTIPLGGFFYEVSKLLIKHGYSFYRDRTEDRINEFHFHLLNGNEVNDEFINKKFDIDDYYSLLTSSINDLENEKIKIYSKIMNSISLENSGKNTKIQIIKTSRELTFNEFKFLAKLYINSKYDLMMPGGKDSQVADILSHSGEEIAFLSNRLVQFGLINNKKPL